MDLEEHCRLLDREHVATHARREHERSAGGQDVLNAGISAVNDGWMKRWESLVARENRFADRLAAMDDFRRTAAMAQQTALALKREVERLMETSAAPRATGSESEAAPAPPDSCWGRASPAAATRSPASTVTPARWGTNGRGGA